MLNTDDKLIFCGKIDSYIYALKNTLDALNRREIDIFAQILLNARASKKNIFVCGNGGSGSTSSHFVCDINKLDKGFKVISLTDNIPSMLAYSNDFDYSKIFIEQLQNFFNEGDVVIGISGSGNSANVIKAIDWAKQNGGVTVGVTGYKGGILKNLAQYSVNANVDDMQISEDIHMILVHVTMRILNEYLHK
ncbi:MAG: SIS domain-containing protein [Bacteroidales bacterium]|nr:SIS domain-containing protein [Bacteroidales bacterium]